MDTRAIGVFDSGLGGLSVVKELKKALPFEDIIYLGDTARVPYGTRSREVVTKFAIDDTSFLVGKKVKCVVIACNTASALASDSLKRKFALPIFDVVASGAKYVAGLGKKGALGIIGTRGTIKSGAYERLIGDINPRIKVFSQACPLLVPLIEEAEIKGEMVEKLIAKYLSPLKKKNIEILILGCTHYPLIKCVIEKEIGKDVTLVDSGKSVAIEVGKFLSENKMLNNSCLAATRKYYVTDLTEHFVEVAELFMGEDIQADLMKVNIV